jgi:hypothetical protein
MGTYRFHFQDQSESQARNKQLQAENLFLFLFGLSFDLENGSDKFLRNVGLSPNYELLQPGRQHSPLSPL